MTVNSSPARFEKPIRVLGISGGVLAAISAVCGLGLLVLFAAHLNAPYFLTYGLLFLMPLAMVLLFVALVLLVLRRRSA